MERCTKVSVDGKDKLLSEKDFYLIKMPHPIDWMLRKYYINPDIVTPNNLLNDYNHSSGALEKYIQVYNNDYLPGFRVVSVSIKSGDYPSGFHLNIRDLVDPGDAMEYFALRFDENDFDMIQLIEKIDMKDEDGYPDYGTRKKYMKWQYENIPDDENDHTLGTVYDRARKKYGIHTIPNKGALTIDDIYDHMKQKRQAELDDKALQRLRDGREMLNELTNDETIPVAPVERTPETGVVPPVAPTPVTSGSIPEERQAQIETMHEAAEDN